MHCAHYNNNLAIYTDGSRSGDSVGCADIRENIIFSYHLRTFSSVFTVELIAIERAMLSISHQHHTSFIIYTDSKKVLFM